MLTKILNELTKVNAPEVPVNEAERANMVVTINAMRVYLADIAGFVEDYGRRVTQDIANLRKEAKEIARNEGPRKAGDYNWVVAAGYLLERLGGFVADNPTGGNAELLRIEEIANDWKETAADAAEFAWASLLGDTAYAARSERDRRKRFEDAIG